MEAFQSIEAFRDALLSKNIVAWVVVVVVLVVVLRGLMRASRWLLVVLSIILTIGVVNHYYPELFEPIKHFVKGGWLGDDEYYGVD